MQALISWIPLSPFLGFLLLICIPLVINREPSEKISSVIGIGSVAIAACITSIIAIPFFINGESFGQYGQTLQVTLWSWLKIGQLNINFDFFIDSLTVVMLSIISGIGLLIHIYSAGYMRGDASFRRYYAYLNLFVSAMLVLVLANNLLLVYVGWEGVGICSYLLIGFWYKDSIKSAAARKAFVVTRIGDTAMALGLLLLFTEFYTLDIQKLMLAISMNSVEPQIITLSALLLLAGAIGKSAQLPLQTWLPDAMAGPTPVSALIHAATMVTAGVYLIARTHNLFLQSDFALLMVATIGTLTLLIAGCSALVQTDIKRVLAYSTISQLGYMFLALGVGAWSSAIFHLMTHAFFKALLFLTAGSIILSLNHEQNIMRMGGLRKKIPFIFICFAVGCACLSAVPFTSGFYSKDEILIHAWTNLNGFNWIWLAGLLGAFITALYSFRLLFLIFFGIEGSASKQCNNSNNTIMTIPLLLLIVLSLLGGNLAPEFGNIFPPENIQNHPHWIEWLAIATPLFGILCAWLWLKNISAQHFKWFSSDMKRWLANGWGFDQLFNFILVRPFLWISGKNNKDIIDFFYYEIATTSKLLHVRFSASQTGQLRWYMITLVFGFILMLTFMVPL